MSQSGNDGEQPRGGEGEILVEGTEGMGSIQISASDEELKGRYANLMSVSHTAEEFVLDFFAVAPSGSTPRGSLVSRVITSPAHFKRLVEALEDNLSKYEAQFGEIDATGAAIPNPEDLGFVH